MCGGLIKSVSKVFGGVLGGGGDDGAAQRAAEQSQAEANAKIAQAKKDADDRVALEVGRRYLRARRR